MAGAPRYHPETMKAVVSSVRQKRSIRNYISGPTVDDPLSIYFQNGSVLNNLHQEVYEDLGYTLPEKNEKVPDPIQESIAQKLCIEKADIRMMGAALGASRFPAKSIRGPVQLFWLSSINTVRIINNSITRCCVTTEEDELKAQTIGKNSKLNYALFLGICTISKHDAAVTGMMYKDLDMIFEALDMMFEYERSEMRGLVTTQGVVAFKHQNGRRNRYAKLQDMKDRVCITSLHEPPETFKHYSVIVDARDLPDSVSLIRSDFPVKYWHGLYSPFSSLRAAKNAENPVQTT